MDAGSGGFAHSDTHLTRAKPMRFLSPDDLRAHVRSQMQEQGISQSALAERLDVAQPAVSYMLHAEGSAYLDLLMRAAEELTGEKVRHAFILGDEPH